MHTATRAHSTSGPWMLLNASSYGPSLTRICSVLSARLTLRCTTLSARTGARWGAVVVPRSYRCPLYARTSHMLLDVAYPESVMGRVHTPKQVNSLPEVAVRWNDHSVRPCTHRCRRHTMTPDDTR